MVNELLLKHYQAGKFGIPIALPNHTFKPNGYPMWAKWQLFPTNAYKGNFRETEQAGLLQITLFVPAGTKTDAIERKAQDIVDWFGVEVQHDIDGQDVMIMSSIAKDAMPDGEGYYMQPIVIAYRVLISAARQEIINSGLLDALDPLERLVNVELYGAVRSLTP